MYKHESNQMIGKISLACKINDLLSCWSKKASLSFKFPQFQISKTFLSCSKLYTFSVKFQLIKVNPLNCYTLPIEAWHKFHATKINTSGHTMGQLVAAVNPGTCVTQLEHYCRHHWLTTYSCIDIRPDSGSTIGWISSYLLGSTQWRETISIKSENTPLSPQVPKIRFLHVWLMSDYFRFVCHACGHSFISRDHWSTSLVFTICLKPKQQNILFSSFEYWIRTQKVEVFKHITQC